MAEIASAYVSLMPSARGFGSSIDKQVGGDIAASGRRGGIGFGKAMGAGLLIGLAGLAAGAKALYEIGQVVDDVQDKIRVGTGATGAELAKLQGSAERVGRNVASSFSEVAPVLVDLNRRLGITGPVLEKLTKQFLDAGRITDEALDADAFTSALNVFDIEGKQAGNVLDALFRISQTTGVSMNELSAAVARNGPNLKQFGFNIAESAALIGTLERSGLDANKTLGTLSRAMVTFAKDGRDPQKALLNTVARIKDFTKAGKDAKAINLAGEIFGTRGASQFVAAIKSGNLNLEDMVAITGKTGDTIEKATKDTDDFSESWQKFKNRVVIGLAPIASQVFDAVGQAGKRMNQELGPGLRQIGDVLRADVVPALQRYYDWIFNKVVPAVREGLVPILRRGKEMFSDIRDAVRENEPELRQLFNAVKKVVNFWATKMVPTGLKIASFVLPLLGHAIGIITDLAGFWIRTFNRAHDAVIETKNSIRDAAGEMQFSALKILVAFKGLPAKLQAIGVNIVTGLVRGISKAAGLVDAAVRALVDRIPAKIRGMMGISSPSKVTQELGEFIGEGLAQGINSKAGKVANALQNVIDGLKSKLSTLRSYFASLSESVSTAFTGNLFESETAGGFIAGLLGTKGQLTQLKAAFKKLIGFGLKPAFLSQLFASGNGGLILDLAAGSKAQANQSASLFSQVTSLSTSLGNQVARADIGPKIDRTNQTLEDIAALIKKLPPGIGKEINGPAGNARRRARAA